MTDDRSPTPTPEQHTDDEVLVALVDGEATAAEAAAAESHLAACAQCAARRAELGATRTLAASPVTPLPEDVREAQIARALAAATEMDRAKGEPVAAGHGEPRPLVHLAARRRWWEGAPARAAAGIVLVAALAAAAYGGIRAFHTGSGTAARGAAAPLGPAGNLLPDRPAPVGWLRRVDPFVPKSCPSQANPLANTVTALPDAVDTPGRPHPTCLTVDVAVGEIPPGVPARLSGPPGLAGPDTLTIEVPARLVRVEPGSPPAGQELVLQADGAAVGVVRSVTIHGGTAEVVVGNVPPPVAEYLMRSFVSH